MKLFRFLQPLFLESQTVVVAAPLREAPSSAIRQPLSDFSFPFQLFKVSAFQLFLPSPIS
jgi:hypothetical protein